MALHGGHGASHERDAGCRLYENYIYMLDRELTTPADA